MIQKFFFLFTIIFSSACYSQIQFDDKVLIHKDITPNDINDFQVIDFDNDGKKDIICMSGSGNKKISLYKNEGNDLYSHHLLISSENNFSNTNTNFLKVIDINDDGYNDLITNGLNRINVFINNGLNIFSEIIVGYGTASNVNYVKIEIADIDNDGYKDIIAERKINSGTSSNLFWFKNDNLNFYPFQINFSNINPVFVDFENDNDMDIICKNGSGGISLISNSGNGTFTNQQILSSSQINFVFDNINLFDFNNDGLNDIAVYDNLNSNNIKLFIKNLNGTYISQTISTGVFNYVTFFDYDDDNDIDILLNKGQGQSSNTKIYFNNLLNFNTSISIYDKLEFDNYNGDKFLYTDMNNDNNKDFIYSINSRIGFLKNNSNNTYISKIISDFSMGNAIVCDLNNDNLFDIILKESKKISWFKNLNNLNFTQINIEEISNDNINIDCGDINNDGDIDILSGRLYYDLQNLNVFNTTIINSILNHSLLIDFDNDNDLDIIGLGSNFASGDVLLFKNNSTASSFITQNLSINSNPLSHFKCVDIDNDNDYDIVQSGNSKIHINTNNIFSTFNLTTSLDSYSYTFGDIDNNGFLDIICSTSVSSIPKLKILYNNNNTFTEAHIFDNFKYPIVNDIDNDGDLDIIGFNTSTGRSVILLNNNSNFTEINLGNYIRSIYGDVIVNYNVIDFDNDGDKDIVMSSEYELIIFSSNLSTLSNNNFEISNNDVFIYPNPVINKCKINTENKIYNVKLYDILGKEIDNINLSDNEIDISFLNKGVYFLKIQFLNSTKTIRLVKN